MDRVNAGTRIALAAGGVLAVGAFVVADIALRGAAAPWWAAVGGPSAIGSAAHVGLDAVGLVGVLGALWLAARDAPRWPLAALLVATAAIMMPIGLVLAFGFRDAELAAGWACVQLVPLAIASGLLAGHRVARTVMMVPTATSLVSAMTLLGAAGLA